MTDTTIQQQLELRRKRDMTRTHIRAALLQEYVANAAKQPKYPVYIPTKGRYATMTTIRALDNTQYVPVVEPQEADLYLARTPHVLILPKNDMGGHYAQAWIQQHARDLGYERYWTIDDDIKRFCLVRKGVAVQIGGNYALWKIEQLAVEQNISIAAPDMVQFAVHTPHNKDYTINTRAHVCVLIKTDTPDYDSSYRVRGHVAFLINTLLQGGSSMLVHNVAIDTLPIAGDKRIAGGCTPDYATDAVQVCSAQIAERYPEYTKIKQDGDIAIRWPELRAAIRQR